MCGGRARCSTRRIRIIGKVVLSDEVRKTARLSLDAANELTVAIRGRNEPITVQGIADARTLSSAAVGDIGSVAA